MTTPGSRARGIGLTILLISAGAGVNFRAGDVFGLLLAFLGLLAGVGLVVAGVRMADDPAPVAPVVFDGGRALAALLRRYHTAVGLVVASSAVTVVSGEAGPVLCFAMFALFLVSLSLVNIRALRGDGGGAPPPPPMRTPGSRARAIGLAILLVSVSAAINVGAGGGFVLLSFIGLLAGVGLVVAGVRMADSPAPIIPAAFDGALSLAALLRRHLPVVGLVMASSAVTVVSGEAGPVLSFALFVLLLLGLSLMNLRALGE